MVIETHAAGSIHVDRLYYNDLAAAFVRGKCPDIAGETNVELIELGRSRGLGVHKFKRTKLPRVTRVLGVLRGLHPRSLLDIGSGRGTFLWPLLDSFPDLQVTALEVSLRRIEELRAVRAGGIDRLRIVQANVEDIKFDDEQFDVVTALEVMEHLHRPQVAAHHLIRVSKRFVVVSVPSKPDDNPEHLRLFNRQALTALFLSAGASKVAVDYVLNHMIAVVTR